MPVLSIVFALMLAGMGTVSSHLWNGQEDRANSSQSVAGASVRVAANAVNSYLRDHPAHDGEISMAALYSGGYLPSWFNIDNRIRAVARLQKGYVFVAPIAGARVPTTAIVEARDMPATLGVANDGQLINSILGVIAFDLPDVIPNGSVVYVI